MNLLGILGSLLGIGGDYLKRRQEIKTLDHQAKIELIKAQAERQAQLARDGLTADANWEMEFARQAASSWKDEYTLFVVSIPAVLSFIPGCDTYVARGFRALAETPLWYQVMLVSIFFATFGIRYWRRSQSDT